MFKYSIGSRFNKLNNISMPITAAAIYSAGSGFGSNKRIIQFQKNASIKKDVNEFIYNVKYNL
jgi:hypothetical protein